MASTPKTSGIHDGHRQRKKDDVLKYGVENMHEHEVLEVLLYYAIPRIDTNEIAHNLLKTFGSLAGVLSASEKDLCSIEGVGKNTAFFLRLLPGIFKLCEKSRLDNTDISQGTEALKNYVMKLYSDVHTESLYCIFISGSKKIVSSKCIATGDVNKVEAPPAEVVKEVLDKNVSDVAIAHNHPYGNAAFSDQDCFYTERLRNTLAMLGISLIDHILFAEGKCISYNECGFSKISPLN